MAYPYNTYPYGYMGMPVSIPIYAPQQQPRGNQHNTGKRVTPNTHPMQQPQGNRHPSKSHPTRGHGNGSHRGGTRGHQAGHAQGQHPQAHLQHPARGHASRGHSTQGHPQRHLTTPIPRSYPRDPSFSSSNPSQPHGRSSFAGRGRSTSNNIKIVGGTVMGGAAGLAAGTFVDNRYGYPQMSGGAFSNDQYADLDQDDFESRGGYYNGLQGDDNDGDDDENDEEDGDDGEGGFEDEDNDEDEDGEDEGEDDDEDEDEDED